MALIRLIGIRLKPVQNWRLFLLIQHATLHSLHTLRVICRSLHNFGIWFQLLLNVFFNNSRGHGVLFFKSTHRFKVLVSQPNLELTCFFYVWSSVAMFKDFNLEIQYFPLISKIWEEAKWKCIERNGIKTLLII